MALVRQCMASFARHGLSHVHVRRNERCLLQRKYLIQRTHMSSSCCQSAILFELEAIAFPNLLTCQISFLILFPSQPTLCAAATVKEEHLPWVTTETHGRLHVRTLSMIYTSYGHHHERLQFTKKQVQAAANCCLSHARLPTDSVSFCYILLATELSPALSLAPTGSRLQ